MTYIDDILGDRTTTQVVPIIYPEEMDGDEEIICLYMSTQQRCDEQNPGGRPVETNGDDDGGGGEPVVGNGDDNDDVNGDDNGGGEPVGASGDANGEGGEPVDASGGDNAGERQETPLIAVLVCSDIREGLMFLNSNYIDGIGSMQALPGAWNGGLGGGGVNGPTLRTLRRKAVFDDDLDRPPKRPKVDDDKEDHDDDGIDDQGDDRDDAEDEDEDIE